MADRLSALDASLLAQERSAPLHVGTVAVLRRPRSGFDYDQLLALIRRRLAGAPRYRQRVVPVPGRLARPVWADDPDFDLTYHVRRSALPRPGAEGQLLDLVARLISRPLDQSRPLWEAYLVEGLARGRLALVTKTHPALVDGVRTVDIGQLILDPTPQLPEREQDDDWRPAGPPGRTRLVLDAVRETVRRPLAVVENVRATATDVVSTARKVVGGLASALDVASPATAGPLTVPTGGQRRFAVARARVADLSGVPGGRLDEVVLAVVTGALRTWLLSRGEPVTASTTLRALVPPHPIDLPVGEPNPVVRLQHIGHALRAHADPVGSLAAGARAATGPAKRAFHLVITQVPGAQRPLYAGTAQLIETFPILPLVRDQALAIGVLSYHGGVYFGLTGDRAGMSDVDSLAGMLEESVDELLTTPRRS